MSDIVTVIRRALVLAVLVASALWFGAGPALAADHSVFAYGDAPFLGSTGRAQLNYPIVGMATTPTADGYWLAARDGRVYSFGRADVRGALASPPASPVVGIAATRTGKGYWLATSTGGIYSFGDAPFLGSLGKVHLTKPIVGIATTRTGRGYWLVAEDGGIFTFGDAGFHGSTGAMRLNQPIVGMASTPSGGGYWLVARDGGIFTFGDAHYYGSTGNIRLARPVVGMAATPSGGGYWLVAADGGVFRFGSAPFLGSLGGGTGLSEPAVGLVSSPSGKGYWLVSTGHLASSPTANAPEVRVYAGTYKVGAAVRPGTYREQYASPSCHWERKSADGATLGSVTSDVRQVVTIEATDATFTTSGCAPFTSDILPVRASMSAPIGDGAWIVNIDVAAGKWKAPGGAACTWSRLSDFSGDPAAVKVSGSPTAESVVDIQADDAGFVTSGCGSWQRV